MNNVIILFEDQEFAKVAVTYADKSNRTQICVAWVRKVENMPIEASALRFVATRVDDFSFFKELELENLQVVS